MEDEEEDEEDEDERTRNAGRRTRNEDDNQEEQEDEQDMGRTRAAGGRQGGRADSPVRVGDVRGVAAGPREHREGVLALTLGASAVVGPAREVQQAGGTEAVGGRRRREVAHAPPTNFDRPR